MHALVAILEDLAVCPGGGVALFAALVQVGLERANDEVLGLVDLDGPFRLGSGTLGEWSSMCRYFFTVSTARRSASTSGLTVLSRATDYVLV